MIKTEKIFKDNNEYFDTSKNIMEWIGQYYDIKDETVLRGFLGRMLLVVLLLLPTLQI